MRSIYAHNQNEPGIIPCISDYPGPVGINGSRFAQDGFIAQKPEEVPGQSVAQTFGDLPFLLKVPDVHKMLSIQAGAASELFRATVPV
jgi:hypothetical protein